MFNYYLFAVLMCFALVFIAFSILFVSKLGTALLNKAIIFIFLLLIVINGYLLWKQPFGEYINIYLIGTMSANFIVLLLYILTRKQILNDTVSSAISL